MKKFLLTLAMVMLAISPVFVFANAALAQNDPLGFNRAQGIGFSTPAENDPREIAVDIIQYLMTFLGIIAVVVILLGGFRWMTAAGNEDKVASAKKTIIAGAIGLIIILAAFAIVTFVVNVANDAVSGTLE